MCKTNYRYSQPDVSLSGNAMPLSYFQFRKYLAQTFIVAVALHYKENVTFAKNAAF
jgi:hypothetical protein